MNRLKRILQWHNILTLVLFAGFFFLCPHNRKN